MEKLIKIIYCILPVRVLSEHISTSQQWTVNTREPPASLHDLTAMEETSRPGTCWICLTVSWRLT